MEKIINKNDIKQANNAKRCEMILAIIKRTSKIPTRDKNTLEEEKGMNTITKKIKMLRCHLALEQHTEQVKRLINVFLSLEEVLSPKTCRLVWNDMLPSPYVEMGMVKILMLVAVKVYSFFSTYTCLLSFNVSIITYFT